MPAAPIIAAVAAAVGTGYSIYSGERAAKKQSQAQAQAEKQAKEQALQAERDFNKANSKKANTAGFRRFPALCPRWTVSGGDIYGHSPGMEALGDIKQLQHEQLRKAQGIDYKTNPPLQVPTSLKYRDVDRLPGGIVYNDTAGSQAGIRPLYEVQLDLNHLLQDIQDVRGRIRSTFYADLFLMLSNQQKLSRNEA